MPTKRERNLGKRLKRWNEFL